MNGLENQPDGFHSVRAMIGLRLFGYRAAAGRRAFAGRIAQTYDGRVDAVDHVNVVDHERRTVGRAGDQFGSVGAGPAGVVRFPSGTRV